jgi:mannosylglycerate hydrolase MGH1-like protein
VLADNDLGGWTRPAPGLFPHQWLWDSCFVAIGLAHVDPQRAAAELWRLIEGQWPDGMLPHIIYNPRLPYRLEALLWDTGRLSPPRVRTSGITQPPLLAVAVERVAAALKPEARRGFVSTMLPALIKYHDWLYRERDPADLGLVACLHSWESGMDDAPYWTAAMNRLPQIPLRLHWLREYRPVKHSERARPADLQHMFDLSATLKRYHYDSRQIIANSSVVVIDLAFNAILAAANESLTRLAEAHNYPLPASLHRHFAPTRDALELLWDAHTGGYLSRDYNTGRLLREPTAATFLPLFAGTASPARAEKLRRQLVGGNGYNAPFPVPSVPTSSPDFNPQRYWRGPVWVNLNWFIIEGLGRYGFTDEADWLRLHTLGLIARSGFREYYDPLTGDGLGANHFSWTAALALDLLARPEPTLT